MSKKLLVIFTALLYVSEAGAQMAAFEKNKVMEYFQNMQYDDAIAYLLPFASGDSVQVQVLSYLGYACQMNEDDDNASRYYQKVLDRDSNHIAANQYFFNLYCNSKPAKAQEYIYRLVKKTPGQAVYQRKMGDIFRRQNIKDSALYYYNNAFQLSPKDSRNGAALADCLIDLKNYARADSIIDQGLLTDSLNILFLKLRIRASYEVDNYRQVLVPGERLMRLGEGGLTVLNQVALSYYNLKQYDSCISVCEYMIEKGLSAEPVFYYEAKAWAKLGEYNKSNDLLKTCLQLAISKSGEYYYNALGENYEAMKQFKTAIAHYDTAYYLFKEPLMLYNCGRILETGLKKEKAANLYYHKYLLNAKPTTPAEKKAYAYIKSKMAKK